MSKKYGIKIDKKKAKNSKELFTAFLVENIFNKVLNYILSKLN